MPECPACFGHGAHDFAGDDAYIAETWTVEEIEDACEAGMTYPLGVMRCDECEGTGVVSDPRAKDLRAAAVAFVDQALAKLHAEGRLVRS